MTFNQNHKYLLITLSIAFFSLFPLLKYLYKFKGHMSIINNIDILKLKSQNEAVWIHRPKI